MIGLKPPTITMPAGSYTTRWDTTDGRGEELRGPLRRWDGGPSEISGEGLYTAI